MRDALFPDAKGLPVGEKAAVPTRFLKNLDYEIEATSTAEYPFLASLQVEFEGTRSPSGAVPENPAELDQRYILTLDFVQAGGDWKLYYSRILSPTAFPEEPTEGGAVGPVESLGGLFDRWRMSSVAPKAGFPSTLGLTDS